jgi:hypothetical protein
METAARAVGTRRSAGAFLQVARPCKVRMQSLPCRFGRPRTCAREHVLVFMEDSTMAVTKQASKRKRRNEVVPALGVVGVSLSLASGASAATAGSVTDMPSKDTATGPGFALTEEEISDVSLGTFYVFDKEDLRAPVGEQVARGCGRGCGGCRGCRGCRGCGRGCGGCGGGCGGCGGCGCCLSWGRCAIC